MGATAILHYVVVPRQSKLPADTNTTRTYDPVQLAYTYSATATYWVDPTTGRIIDLQRNDKRQAGLAALASVPGIPVYDVSTRTTAASVNDAVNDAKSDGNKINNYGKTLPLVLGSIGVVLLIGGILVAVTGRRRPPAVPPGATATPAPE